MNGCPGWMPAAAGQPRARRRLFPRDLPSGVPWLNCGSPRPGARSIQPSTGSLTPRARPRLTRRPDLARESVQQAAQVLAEDDPDLSIESRATDCLPCAVAPPVHAR